MPNYNAIIFYPVLALVLLTCIVWFKMYYVRFTEMKKSGISASEMKPSNRNLPPSIIFSGDNFRNLCEAPIIFYLACVLIYILELSSNLFIVLSWIYVALRYIHSYIHTTYNAIAHRFLIYFFSTIILWVIWFILALKILTAQ